MKGKIIYLLACLLMVWPTHLIAQLFSPVGIGFSTEVRTIFSDTTSGKVYVGGFFEQYSNGDSVNKIAVWDGNSWDSIGSGINDGGICLSIQRYGSDIFFGGSFNFIGGNNFSGLAKWDGLTWGSIGNILSFSPNGGVNKIMSTNTNLYAMGTMTSVIGNYADKIAKWDGFIWHTFPVLDSIGYNLMAAAIYNNELYVGGQFSASSQMKDIAKFDGVNWVPVLNGLSGSGWVGDMVIFQNELYVSGSFQTQNGDPGNGIIKWNGTNWDDLGGGTDAVVYQMKVINNELYIVGSFNQVSGVPASRIAKWDGTQWYGLGISINSTIYSLSAGINEIYIAGHFTQIDGITMNRVAKYTVPVGIEENNFSRNIKIYPIPANEKVVVSLDCIENFKDVKIRFTDIAGRLVLIKNLDGNLNEHTIDISFVNAGSYQVSIETDGVLMSKRKLIVVK